MQTKYEKRLRKIAAYMSEDHRTTRAVKKRFRCSYSAAFTAIQWLGENGAKFAALEGVREGKRGPTSVALRLTHAPTAWR